MKHLTFLFILLHTLLNAQDRISGKSFATRSEVLATHGMVATNHPLASQIGLEILKKGGTAVDAAIAANAFMGLGDPGNNGIGGDLFAIIWDAKTKKLYGLNASGKSPSSLSFEEMQARLGKGENYITGPLSITTPGCVDGWVAMHEKFGKLTMSEILNPTINYAREGFPITEEVGATLELVEPGFVKSGSDNLKNTYFINGRFPRKGEVFKNPKLANSLELIAKEGRKGFYEGAVAKTIVRHVKSEGGFLSLSDLKNNKPEWVDPVSINYRGYDVWEMPPNGQGIAALQILNVLKNFDIESMGYGSVEHIHHFVEAKKLAYEDLSKFYGDPNFGEIPLDMLLSDEYGRKRAELIDPKKPGVYNPGMPAGDHTIYLTTADAEGNMVSLIQSNSYYFGSGEVAEDLGFVLQNRASGFNMKEGHINVYAASKRPFHTIIPAFVTREGVPFLSFGVMGGDMQPQGHAQIIMNIIDFGMNVQEAGDAPRIRHYGTSSRGHVDNRGETCLENGFDMEVKRELMLMGHNLQMRWGGYGGYQAIMKKDDVYFGATESRKDGQAAGY